MDKYKALTKGTVSPGDTVTIAILPESYRGKPFWLLPDEVRVFVRRLRCNQQYGLHLMVNGERKTVNAVTRSTTDEVLYTIHVDDPNTVSTRGNPRGNGGQNAKFGGKTKTVRVPESWSQEMIDNLPDLLNLIQTYKDSCAEAKTSPRYDQAKRMIEEIERLGY